MGSAIMGAGAMPIMAGSPAREPAPLPMALNQERYNDLPVAGREPTAMVSMPRSRAPSRGLSMTGEIDNKFDVRGFVSEALPEASVSIEQGMDESAYSIERAISEEAYSNFS